MNNSDLKAAIDIGTNSVLLTIAKPCTPTGCTAVYEGAEITRLGEGLAQTCSLKPRAMERTIDVIRRYIKICKRHEVGEIKIVGTAAMRKAENAGKLVQAVKSECGLEIEVVSGEREAELTFKAVEADFGKNVVVVDIGGGSTEFVMAGPAVLSIPLGCVMLHEEFIKSDPVNESDFNKISKVIHRYLAPLCSAKRASDTLVATAGTATTLAAIKLKLKKYNHSKVHGLELGIGDIENIIIDLKSRTIKERKKLLGLEPKRADVIFPGALILKAVMKELKFNEVTVSDRGVRWGIVYELLKI